MQLTPEQQAIGEIMIKRQLLRRQIAVINIDRQTAISALEATHQAACQAVNDNHNSETAPLQAEVDALTAQLTGQAPIEG